MPTVLVVDDEPRIADLVRDYLATVGFTVVVADDGPAALESFHRHQPDMVILDLGLPGMDGLDVVRSLRATSDVPIVILTARSDETDRVVGLELGADDYVIKPFGLKELVARVRAVLRRVDVTTESEIHRAADVVVDRPKMRVTVGFAGSAAALVGLSIACGVDLSGRRMGAAQMGLIRGFLLRTLPDGEDRAPPM